MALDYTYANIKDVHSLTNNESSPMAYTISKIDCDKTTNIKVGTLLPNQTSTLIFKQDGNYSITLQIEEEIETVPLIKYYNNLLLSFLSEVEKVLCGCTPCKDCEECNECEDYLSSFAKALAFNSLNFPKYKLYIDTITNSQSCQFNDEILCILNREKIYGSSSLKEVMLRIIATYYLSFYYKDLALVVDQEEKDYINTKYKFLKISKCMRNLGINPTEELEKLEANTTVYYWQLTDVSENIEDVLPLITLPYLNTKPQLPFSTFEAGHIVNYTTVGRIVFAITPTEAINFLLQDSMNNDITDEFTISYVGSLNLVIFVSINPQSISSLYFKFKKLI